MGQGEHTHELRDALPTGYARGRASTLNPGNRFESIRLHVLGEHLDEIAIERAAEGLGPDELPTINTRVFYDRSRTIINHVQSPDIGFSWTINPYRGCEHGCVYCYARPTHEYLGWSCGLDFETKLLAKTDAAPLLRTELSRNSWQGERIVLSGITDPYQPVERSLRITRSILEVCVEFAQPVAFITKNALIARDADLLAELARFNAASASISVTSLDNSLASKLEPRASAPAARLNAIRRLASAGVPVSVMVAPIIPGINDHEIPRILQAACDAGATGAGYVMLRLPYQNKDLFLDWLRTHFPDRAAKVESHVRSLHGGNLYDHAWHTRQRGDGPLADHIEQSFNLFKRRHGFGDRPHISSKQPRNSPREEFERRKSLRLSRGQLNLF